MTGELDSWFVRAKDIPELVSSALVDEIGQLTDSKDVVSIWYLNNTISKPLNGELKALIKNKKSRIR